MPVVELYPSLNVPRVCQNPSYLQEVLEGKALAILDSRYISRDWSEKEYTVKNCTVRVSDKVARNVIDQTWLETPLDKNVACYVPLHGGGGWLPLAMPSMWIVQDATQAPPAPVSTLKDSGLPYVSVEYQEETCLAELCCNAWKYFFNFEKGLFVRHPNPEWNGIKALIRKVITPITGGVDERIADYGRLVLFLLSKISLTKSEQELLAPLLEFTPEIEELAGVIKREHYIQKFITEAKKDPTAFLSWGEDWSSYWWESKEADQ